MFSSVRRIFERGGGRKFRKFENKEDQNNKFSSPKPSPFFCPKLGEDKKKRSSLKFSPVFGPKLGEVQKKGFRAHRFCAQTLCPSYKGGAMPQFCILFYANYTILATQRGGPWPNAPPPKYAPASVSVK